MTRDPLLSSGKFLSPAQVKGHPSLTCVELGRAAQAVAPRGAIHGGHADPGRGGQVVQAGGEGAGGQVVGGGGAGGRGCQQGVGATLRGGPLPGQPVALHPVCLAPPVHLHRATAHRRQLEVSQGRQR